MLPDSIRAQKSDLVRLSFALSESQAGPFPVSSETLWCHPEGGNYRVKNVPFFIDEISFDDLISVRELGNGFYEIENIVSPSKNSTVWLYFQDGKEESALVDNLLAVGCGVEGGIIDGYYAINVPESVGIELVYSSLAEGEANGIVIVDYPSIRH